MTVWLPVGNGAGRSLDCGFGALPASRESGLELRLDGSMVLVVDDEKDSRELLAALFERCGARVVQCESAETAWPMLAAPGTSLLVADIAMPDIDGYESDPELVRQRGGRLPAVAVSAHARPQDRAKALAAGFDGYCAKPIDVDQLLRTVRDVKHACLQR